MGILFVNKRLLVVEDLDFKKVYRYNLK